MTSKSMLLVVLMLSVILGVDAKRSARKTEKLYRKAGKWQRKLRGVWELLGVKPFLVQPGEEGDECVLKSKITVDDAADKGDYMLKSTVEADYVLKGADVFTQAELDAAVATATAGPITPDQYREAWDAALDQGCNDQGATDGTWGADLMHGADATCQHITGFILFCYCSSTPAFPNPICECSYR